MSVVERKDLVVAVFVVILIRIFAGLVPSIDSRLKL
jgi:hypothetical protein